MKSISLFTIPHQKKSYSERADLIKYFTDEINRERRNTKYKPIKPIVVAIKLRDIEDIQDIYFMQSVAKDIKNRGGSVSKYFFGSLKVGDKRIVQKSTHDTFGVLKESSI